MNHRPAVSTRRSLSAAVLLVAALGTGLMESPAHAASLPTPPAGVAPLSSGLAVAPLAVAPVAKPAPLASKPTAVPVRKAATRGKSRRLSKATLAALQPVSLPAVADAPAAPAALAHLSPVVKQRASTSTDSAPVADSPLARALDTSTTGSARQVSTQVLPAQEEALALARQQAAPEVAASLPEEPGARVRKDVETGPMRLRVRRQAVQMSVEFPFQ